MSGPPQPARTAAWLQRLEANGELPYGAVDGEEVLYIPSRCVRGRSGGHGKVFSGMLDLRAGRIRIDSADDSAFWIEIDLFNAPGLAYAPGGAGPDVAQRPDNPQHSV